MKKKGRRELVGVDVVAEDCGVTPRQIWNLVRDKGLPQEKKGKFDRERVRKWWGEYKAAGGSDPKLRDAEIRLKIVQAETQELKLAAARGELVSVHLVRKSLERIFGAFAARLNSIPKKAVPVLRPQIGKAKGEKALREMVREALDELTDTDFSGIVGGTIEDLSNGRGNGTPAPSRPNRLGVGG